MRIGNRIGIEQEIEQEISISANADNAKMKHLDANRNCKELCNNECFEIIDSATSSYRLKLKEAMHITWEKPSLNKQLST